MTERRRDNNKKKKNMSVGLRYNMGLSDTAKERVTGTASKNGVIQ